MQVALSMYQLCGLVFLKCDILAKYNKRDHEKDHVKSAMQFGQFQCSVDNLIQSNMLKENLAGDKLGQHESPRRLKFVMYNYPEF